jgi:hypothetical protein
MKCQDLQMPQSRKPEEHKGLLTRWGPKRLFFKFASFLAAQGYVYFPLFLPFSRDS